MIILIKDIANNADEYLNSIEADISRTEIQIRAAQANGGMRILDEIKLGLQMTHVVCAGVVCSLIGEERPN